MKEQMLRDGMKVGQQLTRMNMKMDTVDKPVFHVPDHNFHEVVIITQSSTLNPKNKHKIYITYANLFEEMKKLEQSFSSN